MFNKFSYTNACFLAFAFLLLLYSCTCSNNSNNNADTRVGAVVKQETPEKQKELIVEKAPEFTVNQDGLLEINYNQEITSIEYAFYDFPTQNYYGEPPIDLGRLVRSEESARYEIAYNLLTDNVIPITIVVNKRYRDIIPYHYHPQKASGIDGKILSGKACRLVYSSDNISKADVKRWLYRQGYPLGEDKIDAMFSIVRDLSFDSLLHLEQDTDIPTLISFSSQRYRVSSNMKADHYYLFAAEHKKEVDQFIEDMISDDFPESSKNLASTIPCFRASDIINSYKLLVICLVGIDKDWKSQILPLGLVQLDRKGPSYGDPYVFRGLLPNTSYSLETDFGINHVVTRSNVNEYYEVSVGECYGHNANFTVKFGPKVESISFQLGNVTRTEKLSNKHSPATLNVFLPLAIGDNIVSITAKDVLGNESFPHIEHIRMIRIEDNSGITVENNINIYN